MSVMSIHRIVCSRLQDIEQGDPRGEALLLLIVSTTNSVLVEYYKIMQSIYLLLVLLTQY